MYDHKYDDGYSIIMILDIVLLYDYGMIMGIYSS